MARSRENTGQHASGCSLGNGDRRILCLLRKFFGEILMAWSSAVYFFYSDVEPLCSRKLYLAKMVSFFSFQEDIHRMH